MSSSDKAPNILFIAVDDLRPEARCFGKQRLHTPYLDRLAEQATLFNQAHCNFPQCMASRASVMTSIRPPSGFHQRSSQLLPAGAPSLIGHFRQNGYSTVQVGKVYHHHNDDVESWTQMFQEGLSENSEVNYGSYQLPENQARECNRTWRWRDVPIETLPPITEAADAPDNAYADGKIAARAVEQLQELATQAEPWFLAVGFIRPHMPWAVPQRYWDLYNREDVVLADNPYLPRNAVGATDLCDFMQFGERAIHETFSDLGNYAEHNFPVLDDDTQRRCVHGYWASVSFMDAQLGKILDQLEASGEADNTIIVLWGDNGFHLGEHALWSKVSHFEESSRVPLIISAPGFRRAQESNALCELLDLYPTLCDLAGLEQPGHVQGTSLRQLLEDTNRLGKQVIYFNAYSEGRDAVSSTIRSQEFRLTLHPSVGGGPSVHHLIETCSEVELFDLRVDPRENVNVAADSNYHDDISRLRSLLESSEIFPQRAL